eukprot:TRINITY_DN684_c1_g1_i4.p1 TRINITY_DN684_c1_g1~~TRINITY_DN684_c1_g1_i4.p1  ORF type:complete len:281 (-),score=44.40 TRINITY_DN684_c1_g1_i4:634-1476(-)
MSVLPDMLQRSIMYQSYGDELRRMGRRSRSSSWFNWITFSVTTTLVVWGIWQGLQVLASYHDERKKQQQKLPGQNKQLVISDDVVVPKFSPMVVNLLLETDVMPYLVIDVRQAADSAMNRLPLNMRKHSVNLPIASLAPALSSRKVWQEMFPFVPYPMHQDILLFVGITENLMKYGAALASGLGFQRVAILEGSIQQYVASTESHQGIKKLNRDVLSVLTDILIKTWPDLHESEEDEYEDVQEVVHSDTERLSFFDYNYGLERRPSLSPQSSVMSKTPRQ